MHWDSSIYFILSLNLGLLMTLTRCCGGLMMCSILLDESTTHVSKAARSSCLYVFFAEKLDSLLDHLDNRHKMHGSQNIAIDCWSRNQNGTRYCSHAMLHVYKYAFRLARMAISHSSFSRLGFPFLALGLLAMEDKRGTKRPRSPSTEGSLLPNDAKTPLLVSSRSPPPPGSPSEISSRHPRSLVCE
jgi:hypothetical protein